MTQRKVSSQRQAATKPAECVAQARSRYEEDLHPNNHTSVWGSWWRDGEWGYACCHQSVKNSYCMGEAGLHAQEESMAAQQQNMDAKAAAAPPTTTAAAPAVWLSYPPCCTPPPIPFPPIHSAGNIRRAWQSFDHLKMPPPPLPPPT